MLKKVNRIRTHTFSQILRLWKKAVAIRLQMYVRLRFAILLLSRHVSRLIDKKLIVVLFVVISFCALSIWFNHSSDRGKGVAKILFENAESIAITSAAVIFFIEIPDRKKKELYEAWQVVNSAQGQTGSGGRIQALEDLNSNRVDLTGVLLSKAYLSEINLEGGNLRRANFEYAHLSQANLSDASIDIIGNSSD